MNTVATDRVSHPIVADIYEQYRNAGCENIVAAVLTLAEVVRGLPSEITATVATSLGAISGLAAGLERGGARSHAGQDESSDAPWRESSVSIPINVNQRESMTPTTVAARPKENGKKAMRGRAVRNRADMRVLESFLTTDETKGLAVFFDSVGVSLTETNKVQQLLTLIVYYVNKICKVKCTHSHIHTVLKKIGIGTPSDLGARLRDVSRRLGYIDASNGQDIRMTMKGENWVDIELPKRKAQVKAAKN